MFKKLVVGVDFSVNGERAIGSGITLARASGGSLVLVHVLPRLSEVKEAGDTELLNSMQQRMAELATRLSGENGIKVDWGVVDGDPAKELNRFVDTWGGDALVVGSAGRSALGKVLVGSVTEALVHHARVPVVVIGPNAHA